MQPGRVGAASQPSCAWVGCLVAAGAACFAGAALSYSSRLRHSLLGIGEHKEATPSPAVAASTDPDPLCESAQIPEPNAMGETAHLEKAKEVADTQADILKRISLLEGNVDPVDGSNRCTLLKQRQIQVLDRLRIIEAGLGQEAPTVSSCVEGTRPVSEVQARLSKVLQADGIKTFRFVRAPPEYYSESLEFRMGIVKAASVHHLCKTIIMQNTRAPPDVTDCSNPTLSKYYMVCVQYTAKLHADKLHSFVRSLANDNGHTLSKKQVNMRLVPEEINDQLTGFSHNAVAPVGCAVKIPMIVSHKIAALDPDFFWLGGGEVDLKLGFKWAEFCETYQPFVVDCTYD